MEQRVLTRLRKDFQVGSEEWNDVTFTGHRIRWTQDSQNRPYIEVSRHTAIDELEESQWNETRKKTSMHSFDAHTVFRSLLGQINWLQSRTQFQCCYKFSRCASMAASPTIGNVKSLNKLARQIKSQPVTLQYWPLTGPLRILGFPDASCRDNDDGSSQRGMTVCFAESRERLSKDGMSFGSLVDFESQRIKKIVLSTTVAELYSFMKCFGSCQFLRGLWMDLSGEVAKIHMRTDANKLAITARTNHLPERKDAIHIISMLRKRKPAQEIFMILLTLQLKIAWQTLTKASAKADILIRQENWLMLTFTMILEPLWSTRPSCQPGVKHFCTHGRRKLSS